MILYMFFAIIPTLLCYKDSRMRDRLLICCLMSLVVLLSACGPATPEVLPTVLDVPTANTTLTPTDTLTPSETPTLTPTGTLPPTLTPSITPTPSETFTPSPVPTETVTVTPSLTITDTPSPTATITPTSTPEPGTFTSLLELAMQATILPVTPFAAPIPGVPTLPPSNVSCAHAAPGALGGIVSANPDIGGQLGCPLGQPPTAQAITTAYQLFEHGAMVYVAGSPGRIYVLFEDGRLREFRDSWIEGTDPVSGGETPPEGKKEPIRGFGKIWRANADVRAGLGWALIDESGAQASMVTFDRGMLLYLPQRNQTIAIIQSPGATEGRWSAYPGGG